jgi:prepilin-type N-terminal cleavage/methylation domain-containing protein
MRSVRAQRGFTLIEMMVVVAIIAILSLLLISASSRPVGASARNSAEQMVSTINFAKLRAQATRRVHLVQFDQGHAWVRVASSTGLVPPVTTTYNDVVQTITFPNGVKIYDVDGMAHSTPVGSASDNTVLNSTPYELYIRPDGQSTASTLFIGDGVHQFRVIVYPITGGTYAREWW